MIEKTFSCDGVTITVRESTRRDRANRFAMQVKLGVDGEPPEDALEADRFYNKRVFIGQVSRVSAAEGLPFALPSPADDAAALEAAFEAWLDLPERLIDAWTEAASAVEGPALPAAGPGGSLEDADPLAEAGASASAPT
ncbi:MAG: hypothetical protein PHW33_04040 [Candidatus Portnoybacteria bacterium]|nr:hypothetical protein [Candidatus Portnoybacteria bacterium]MDD5002374.1 hypothetical protein [Thiomonas arsenitoxydans]